MNSEEQIPANDAELDQITVEEERVLARVLKHLANRKLRRTGPGIDYEAELLALRDQINEARLEDIPPLIEEMERLAEVAQRRAKVAEGAADPRSPYFGRMVLEEGPRKREVLIGRATYLDSKTGIRIVDWRDAPVSRLYYRYEEGDDYEEKFGGRYVEGEILTRRSLAIQRGELRRIGAPQGTFLLRKDGWQRAGESARKLSGGQGAAMRAEEHHQPGRLGVGNDGDGRDDRFLPEITALIDPRQFELITAADSGLVVIQGGAGSGKTTIGLHRLAYLNFQDKKRFRANSMLVLVFNRALQRYISKVLPALGVEGVVVSTYEAWAAKLRKRIVRGLPSGYDEETPSIVTRLKKHPQMLVAIDNHVERLADRVEASLRQSLKGVDGAERIISLWEKYPGAPLAQRLEVLGRAVRPRKKKDDGRQPANVPVSMRHAVERAVERGQALAADVVGAWSELLTDMGALEEALGDECGMSAAELRAAHAWCTRKCPEIAAQAEVAREHEPDQSRGNKRDRRRGRNSRRDEDRGERVRGIDGRAEDERARLDAEDDTLLLRLVQRMWGPLRRGQERVTYSHMLLDEAQDMSPVELAVVVGTASDEQSITLAGDVAQRLMMDNGFSGWDDALGRLGLSHVAVEPLRISYRSTAEIIEFAKDVLGPLRNEEESNATRHGAPVEVFEFAYSGEAVAFLADALRELMLGEPRASVALISRYPEQADVYFDGLKKAEVPHIRRIADQDFPFRAGIDVTDVRQVKGLEFDYVVLLEVSSGSYPEDDEARHLLHIAATRAAHQLWVVTTDQPSKLLPSV